MWKIASIALLIVVLVVAAAMLWQHSRYVGIRREIVHDRQAIFHSGDAFHTVLFLASAPGSDVLEELRALKRATEGSEASWIYAGKAVLRALESEQVGEKDWSAIVLLQYPSRETYEEHAETAELRTALGRFDEVYTQGFRRWRGVNVMVHQLFLAARTGQILRGRPSHFPFTRAESAENLPRAAEFAGRLLEERELGGDAVVIVNLLKDGSPEQQAANRGYGLAMFGAMAEGGYGIMHIGQAVRVERDYDFDQVAIVYYPGVDFFVDMIRSEFFQGISGDKQLGDTQAIITVPILDRL